MPEAGSIDVGLSEVQGGVEIRVSDNGRGIPELIRGQLFEPFVSHGKENGTGLGLTVVQKIVQDHGGDVIVEKTSAEGTVFRLLLPLAASSERCLRQGTGQGAADAAGPDRAVAIGVAFPESDGSGSPRIRVRAQSAAVAQIAQDSFCGRRIVKHKNGLPGRIRRFGVDGIVSPCGKCSWDGRKRRLRRRRNHADAMTDAVRELQEEVRELRNAVVELRSEAGQYRAETEQLRRELQAARSPGTAPEAAATPVLRSGVPDSGASRSIGRPGRFSGRILAVAEQQGRRSVPDQS